MNKAHLSVLEDSADILTLTTNQIDRFLKGEVEHLTQTEIIKEIVKRTSYPMSLVQSLVSLYISRREDVKSKKGPGGELQRIPQEKKEAT